MENDLPKKPDPKTLYEQMIIFLSSRELTLNALAKTLGIGQKELDMIIDEHCGTQNNGASKPS